MKKRIVLTVLLVLTVFGAAYTQSTVQRSLYVSAKGDDDNNGRSETTPYKTLRKAAEAANAGIIKTITIIGTIDEGEISQSGADEILITGKQGANEAERAVISGVISVGGKVRFTHIRLGGISGGDGSMVTLGVGVVVTNPNYNNNFRGVGISVETLIMTDDATITGCYAEGFSREYGDDSVTMSGNTSITNNGKGGISNYGGKVIMSGNAKVSNNKGIGINCSHLTMSENAEISGNVYSEDDIDSGGVMVIRRSYSGASLTMSGNARIINNTTKGNGGGVYFYADGTDDKITISGNARISGNTAKNGGGIYFASSSSGILTMEGGEISDNKAEYGAGVYVERGTFNHKGGTITKNNAEFVGGGVYVKSGATYTAGGSKINGNTAGDGGEDLFRQ